MTKSLKSRAVKEFDVGMKRTLEVLNRMVADKVIDSYAIGGAVAAYAYIEPTMTDGLDVLVSIDNAASSSGLVTLTPIIRYLADNGYTEYRKEGIVVAGWPVQFLPVASPLDAEALEHSVPTEIAINSHEGSVNAPILTAEHVMATALSVGRPKDFIRLSQFIEAGAFDSGALCGILDRHGIRDKWTAFCARFEISDPCADGLTP